MIFTLSYKHIQTFNTYFSTNNSFLFFPELKVICFHISYLIHKLLFLNLFVFACYFFIFVCRNLMICSSNYEFVLNLMYLNWCLSIFVWNVVDMRNVATVTHSWRRHGRQEIRVWNILHILNIETFFKKVREYRLEFISSDLFYKIDI